MIPVAQATSDVCYVCGCVCDEEIPDLVDVASAISRDSDDLVVVCEGCSAELLRWITQRN